MEKLKTRIPHPIEAGREIYADRRTLLKGSFTGGVMVLVGAAFASREIALQVGNNPKDAKDLPQKVVRGDGLEEMVSDNKEEAGKIGAGVGLIAIGSVVNQVSKDKILSRRDLLKLGAAPVALAAVKGLMDSKSNPLNDILSNSR